MEVSVVGRQAVAAAGLEVPGLPALSRRGEPRRSGELAFCRLPAWARARRAVRGLRAALRTDQMGGEAAKKAALRTEGPRRPVLDRPPLFVGLPLDAVSDCNTLNLAKAMTAGLKALKLLGVDGVELPIWWGVAEKEAMGRYDWSGYLELVQMIQDAGLRVRASLYTHASMDPAIPLPQWVSAIGEADPDIFFTDKAGNHHRGCLSLAVDELPVLEGKTPMQVYRALLQSFRAAFSGFLGSTITDVLVGLGPDGELKYPSVPPARNRRVTGVGEFQCCDKNMLVQLKQHAQATGNHQWGLSGPHDAPHYSQSPESTNFFRDNGGSWETPYGDFFLSWYSEQLLSHGDRMLSIASSELGDLPVTIHGKLPVMHPWCKSRSHPSELTAGFYNTADRDGYDAFAEMFSRNSSSMILSSMDLSDEHQPQASRSSPESLLSQMMRSCKKHGVRVSGENSSIQGVPDSLNKIKETLSRGRASGIEDAMVEKFTYQRMGAFFFSPEHFPMFTQFVRSLDWSEFHPDDLPADGEESIPLTASVALESSKEMQAV